MVRSLLGVVAALALLAPATASGWTHQRADEGAPLRLMADNPWVDAPYLPLAAYTPNRANVTAEQLQFSVISALHRWQYASEGAFAFDYWQGADPEVFVPRQERDGLSSLFFSSADPDGTPLDGRTPAWTRVWFDEETHAIVEADIVLNDIFFGFTTDPELVTYDSGGVLGQTLLLDDVITHELGHALGLDHSGLGSATMFTWSWFGQSDPNCDDQAAIRDLYGVQEAGGSLSGRVLDPWGLPLVGAQVVLVSTRRGGVFQSVLTGRDGGWSLPVRQDDELIVLVEPFAAGAEALSAYYRGLDHEVCEPGPFERTFATRAVDPASPEIFAVGQGSDLFVPPIVVRCGDEPLATVQAGDSPAVAPLLGVGPELGFAFVDVAPAGPLDRWFLLEDVSEPFTLDVLAWSLGSPVRVTPTLFDPEGRELAGVELEQPVLSEPSGYTAWDARLWIEPEEAGDLLLRLESNALPATLYPGGDRTRDATPFVLLIARPGSGADDLPARDRLDCALPDLVSPYLGRSGPPRRREVPGGCAMAGAGATGPMSAALVVMAALLAARRRRRSAGQPS
jgi:MYXO-CTERM domain-containing protein